MHGATIKKIQNEFIGVFFNAFIYTKVCHFKVKGSGISSITSCNSLSPEDISSTSPWNNTYIKHTLYQLYSWKERWGEKAIICVPG